MGAQQTVARWGANAVSRAVKLKALLTSELAQSNTSVGRLLPASPSSQFETLARSEKESDKGSGIKVLMSMIDTVCYPSLPHPPQTPPGPTPTK